MIIFPRSACPGCNTVIRFYDNVPVLSFLWLKGRCRHCSQSISFRYPLVEIIGGVCALCTFFKFGLTFEGAVYFIFFTALIVITFIDIDHRIIPNVISLPGILLFFVASFGMPEIGFKDSLLGILAGGGSLLFVAWLYEIVRKKTGMGGGDIKLLAMIGALIGWPGVLFTIYVASISGTFAGLLTMIYKRERSLKLAIPFGPFLSIGAIFYVFFGDVIKNWYFTFLG